MSNKFVMSKRYSAYLAKAELEVLRSEGDRHLVMFKDSGEVQIQEEISNGHIACTPTLDDRERCLALDEFNLDEDFYLDDLEEERVKAAIAKAEGK